MPTALITGASGFIGHWIARLAPPSYHLRLLARPNSDLSALERVGVVSERVTGDLTDPASLRAAVDGVDTVIHAAGWISFRRADAEKVRAANFTGTQLLFKAALAAGVSKVVYTASIFALGYAAGGVVSPHAPHTASEFFDIPYFRAKVDAEAMAQRLIEQGLPLVRLYPGICLGPGDVNHSSNGFILGWLKGQLPALTAGGICFIDVRDAAQAHWLAVERGEGGARYCAPGYNLTHRQLFTLLSQEMGKAAPMLTVPVWAGVLGAMVMERFMKAPPLHRDEARLMARWWWYDNRTAREVLGLTYRPLLETIRDAKGDWETAGRSVVLTPVPSTTPQIPPIPCSARRG